jgi:hypothetical protein
MRFVVASISCYGLKTVNASVLYQNPAIVIELSSSWSEK